jgi:hypothetical protein
VKKDRSITMRVDEKTFQRLFMNALRDRRWKCFFGLKQGVLQPDAKAKAILVWNLKAGTMRRAGP